ncbi:MAG: cell division protein ZapA [Enterobacterales bacterium]|nr:cell division protein ZapA [Enterobacterales bacterium]
MADNKPVTIHILGNEYHVASPEDEVEKLEQAAKALDARMREIKEGGRIMGLEKVAVMAALNLSYELMHGNAMSEEEAQAVDQRIETLQNKIESALAANAQPDLI